jgi:hypothetical protein
MTAAAMASSSMTTAIQRVWSVGGGDVDARRERGARCDSAEPAAIFDARLVEPERSTFDAARAARADVFRERAT